MSKRILWPCFAVSGKKQSGKDLSAKIIDYIVTNVSTDDDFDLPLTYENFKNHKLLRDCDKKYKTYGTEFTFATGLKKILSAILNVPIEYFEYDSYKTNYYINLKTFEHIDNVNGKNEIVKTNNIKSLREIMQEIGSYIEPYFGNDIWAKTIISKIKEIIKANNSSNYNYIPIITDLRRKIELETIKNNINEKEYVIIRIIRKLAPNDWVKNLKLDDDFNGNKDFQDFLKTEFNNIEDKITLIEFIKKLSNSRFSDYNEHVKTIIKSSLHETETDLDDYNFENIIYNDGTIEELFNNILNFLKNISKNYYYGN